MNPGSGFIYLDYAATTPVDERVAELVATLMTRSGDFANASSEHIAGRQSRVHVRHAAERLAAMLNVSPECLLWTSGATESNNLAILGAARARASRGRHLVTMTTEHKAVTDVFRRLEREGFEVSWLAPQSDGRLDSGTLATALRADTQLVSIMHVNNETGVIQDIEAIGELCRDQDVLYHVDAAQSAGKLALDLSAMPVDLLSISAHKMYGPKGIGALYVADRPGVYVEPLLFGGSQQRGLRPGTLPVSLIAGLGLAAEIAVSRMHADLKHLTMLRAQFLHGIRDLSGLIVNGASEHAFAGILNIAVGDIEGESLLLALEPLCVARGSACNAQNLEPSAVLRALGRSDIEAQSSMRFSFGRVTTTEEVAFAVERYREAVNRLRTLAPKAP